MTQRQLHDRRNIRSASGAFLVLSFLANEKKVLRQQLERTHRLNREILVRLSAIQHQEQLTQRGVWQPAVPSAIAAKPRAAEVSDSPQ